MNKIIGLVFIFIIMIFLVVAIIKHSNTKKNIVNIAIDDIDYFINNRKGSTDFALLKDNNKLNILKNKKNSFLFISFDNRKDIMYLDKHNENIDEYVNKYGYEYKFTDTCHHNVYWCKIRLVLEELETNKYDYVVWLDTDTAIQNINVDINDIVNKYDSDILVGDDNHRLQDLINAGVFIIKNSDNGKQFLKDCIGNVKDICFNKDGSLNGYWAASCYEQGQMNILIKNKYSKNTTVLPTNLIFNYDKCSNNTFIMHFYRSGKKNMNHCFTK